MKKIVFVLTVIIFTCFLSFNALAAEATDDFKSSVEGSFFSSLGPELENLLESFGIDSFDGQNILSVASENIKEYFSVTAAEKLRSASGWFFLCICIVMLLSTVSSLFEFSFSGDMLSVFSAAIICLVTVGKISSFLGCVLSVMELNGKFMLCFIPVFALLISLSGNPATALAYNGMLLFFCESMSFFLSNGFVFVTGIYFSLSIGFSFNSGINLNRFVNAVNRIVSLVLGFAGTIFASLLSIKKVLAVSTDSLSSKGISFLLSNLVPVIGSSLSQAYSSVLGSINLMRSSLAIVGILALVLINIPPLTEGVVYFFLMSVLSCLAEIMGLYRVSEIFRALASCIKILLLICIFQVFILIISIGLMLSLKG